MRLLTHNGRGEPCMTENLADDDVPPYAILSHTWGKNEEEVTLYEIGTMAGRQKAGYWKIEFCGRQAQRDQLQHFWVDTCCINKDKDAELSRAITSMYRWYQRARVCYVYLADVSYSQDTLDAAISRPWEASFRQSRWFTRGWTLQELLAPREVVFYSREGSCLGTKSELRDLIHAVTGIPTSALDGRPLSEFPVIERMRWTKGRQTTEKEDQAYCLLGIFGVFMYLNYGEGEHAFRRLQTEIDNQSHKVVDSSHRPAEVGPLGLCLNAAPLIQPSEFIGRAIEIDDIHNILHPDQSATQQRRAVLGGIGGVGKTQLAIAYARRYERNYTSVLWLNASSELTLYTSLRQVASSLSTVSEKLDNEQVLGRFHKWLADCHNTGWLLIFDNYDDPDQFEINHFYPTIGHGSIIVTTRQPEEVIGSLVRVQPFTVIDDGLVVLQVRSGRKDVNNDIGARRLAERMAGLPLALATAGAYLRKSTLSFQQYLDVYEQRWRVGCRPPRLYEYADRTLYTTWNLSYSRLKTDDPEAARMLQLLAYFDHQAVWYKLVGAGLSEGSPEWLRLCSTEQVDFESVMSRLVEYCFVGVQAATESYSVHACVHDWILGELNHDIDHTLYWYAFDCVAALVPREAWDSLGHAQYARLTPHAVRLTHRQFETAGQDIAATRFTKAENVAELLQKQVRLDASVVIRTRVLAGMEQVLGPDDLWTFITVRNLGAVYADQGKLEQAEQMYERVLAGREYKLGPDHIDTLYAVNNLATIYTRQGKLEQAEQMFTRALAGKEQVLGSDHIETLNTVHNLGNLYIDQGKLEQAEQMYTRALAGIEHIFGPDHIETLETVNNLGTLYAEQGKLEQAEELFTRALVGYEQASQPLNIRAIQPVFNLGLLCKDQGRLAKAEQWFQRAVREREQMLGVSHPETVKAIDALRKLRLRMTQKQGECP